MEQFPGNSEKAPINREEVVNRLKEYGLEDETTKELFIKYIEQLRTAAQSIENKKEQYAASIEAEIEIATVYEDGGLLEDALESYVDAREFAYQAYQDETCERIDYMVELLKKKMV